jgi:hypothetical protein
MDKQIKTAIQQLAGTHKQDNVYLFDALVVSVDTANRTCIVTKTGGATSGNVVVRLMASVDDGCYIIPSIDSSVVVLGSDNVKPYVSQYSEVDSIIWLGGENDGVPLVKPLLEKINNLEKLLNSLIAKFNSHTHILTLTVGTGTAAPTTTTESDTIIPTVKTDLEHTKIKH